MASANRSLAKFELINIPPAPRGVPQIDVTFDIDANGILSVSAKDQSSGQEQAVKVTPSSGLSSDEIKKIIEDAQVKADDDRRQKEMTILRNRMGGLLQTTSKTFTEFGWLLGETDQVLVRDSLKQAKNVQEGLVTDIDFPLLMQNLERSAALLTQAMFSSQSSTKGPEPSKEDDPLLSWLGNSKIENK